MVYYIYMEPFWRYIMNKRVLKEQLGMLFGTFVLAVSINVFLTPNKVSAGGVSSLGTILLYLFGMKLSLTNLAANVLLFLLGYRMLGKQAVLKTALGIVYLSVFLELTLLIPAYTEDLLMATLFGGLLLGVGVGFVVRQGASTGGSDFAGLMLKRVFPHISIATLIMCIDVLIVLLTGIVFKSLTVTLYSITALVIASVATDKVVEIGEHAKAVRLFSTEARQIADAVLNEFDRGATGIPCMGMYTGREMQMLLCVVSPKQVPLLVKKARSIDPCVFVIIEDAHEVVGEGFKSGEEYDTIG